MAGSHNTDPVGIKLVRIKTGHFPRLERGQHGRLVGKGHVAEQPANFFVSLAPKPLLKPGERGSGIIIPEIAADPAGEPVNLEALPPLDPRLAGDQIGIIPVQCVSQRIDGIHTGDDHSSFCLCHSVLPNGC